MEVKRQIRQNVIANWEAWKAAKAEIDPRKRQVEASMVAREGVYYENVLGARTVLDTLDADQELLDARVSLVTAKRNEIVTRFSLAASLGLLTPVNIGFGDEKYDFEEHLNTVSSNILGTNVDIDKESYD